MATSAALAYAPPSGTYLEETAMPVGVDQLVLPDALTWNGTDYLGAEGSYTVWELDSAGLATAEAVTIAPAATAPQGTVNIGSATIAATTATVPFTYSAADQTGFEYRVNAGTWTAGTSPLSLTGLTPETAYTVEVRAVNGEGPGTAASTTFTTAAAIVPSTASVTVAYGPGPGWNHVSVAHPLTSPELFAGWSREPLPGEQLLIRSEHGQWTPSGDLQVNVETILPVLLIADDGMAYALTVDSEGLATAQPDTDEVPAGVITFGEATVTPDSIGGTFEYSESDATGFQGRINGGEWGEISSPFSFTSLTWDTQYAIDARAVNQHGPGAVFTLVERTLPMPAGAPVVSVAVPPAGLYTVADTLTFTVTWDDVVTVTGTPVLLLTLDGEQRAAEYVSGDGTAVLVFSYTVQAGDNAADGVQLVAVALSGGAITDSESLPAGLVLAGVDDTSGVIVDAVPPAITLSSINTFSTSPLVSGLADDAVSLTLVVDGETYTPTPVNGIWSQQLPELALGTYAMTLTGEDAAGNEAGPVVATLRIRERPPVVGRGLFRPLSRRAGGPLSSSLFR